MATGEIVRVHVERVKIEDDVSKIECKNARACYPTNVAEEEYTEMEQDIKGNCGLEVLDDILDVEKLVNGGIPFDTGTVAEIEEGYRTRSKGKVPGENWVMERAL